MTTTNTTTPTRWVIRNGEHFVAGFVRAKTSITYDPYEAETFSTEEAARRTLVNRGLFGSGWTVEGRDPIPTITVPTGGDVERRLSADPAHRVLTSNAEFTTFGSAETLASDTPAQVKA